MAVDADLKLIADHVLAANARRGVRSSFDELYRRHALACWRLAVVVTRDGRGAQDAVANGFASTLARVPEADLAGGGESLRVSLLRATRRSAIDVVSERAPGTTSRSEPLALSAAADPRASATRRAFEELPERWRSALWLVEVDGVSQADAALVIGVEAAAIAPLLERAHRGLQEQVLLVGVAGSTPAACRRTSDRLTDYRAGTLAATDEAQVRSHLDRCAACRARLASLDDLIPVLRSVGLPLPEALDHDAAARWSAALVVVSGPLHLVLPGGQPMPVWAQRAFAGVVAGVIALGITGATMIAGRGRGGGRDVIARPELAGGESALGTTGLSDLDLPSDGLDLPTTPPARTSSAPAAPASAATGLPLPRTDNPSGASDKPVPPPVIAPGGGNVERPSQDDDPGPTSQALAVVVDGVGGVTISPDCQGGELLGQSFGCALPEPTGPVTVSVPLAAPTVTSLLGH